MAMANLVQFSVDDTSPVFIYSPFADTLDLPDLSAGWNPYFFPTGFVSAPGQVGVGESQHITARNNASVTLDWNGTAIQLFGNTTANASFNLSLDGSPIQPNQTNASLNLLTNFEGLPNTRHSIVLIADTQDPNSLVVFDKAVITSPPPDDFSQIIFTQHTIDDNDIAFSGQWTFLPSSTSSSFRQSQLQGDTATVTFSGISVRIFGATSPTSGNYSVLLDDNQSPIYSARSSFTNSNTLLFFASGLAPNTSHKISLRNEGGILQFTSGGFTIFSSGDPTALPPPGNTVPSSNSTFPPTTPPPTSATDNRFTRGTIAALVLAGFLSFLILSAVLFYFCIWRPRRRRRRHRSQRECDFAYTQPFRRSHHPRKPVFRAQRDIPSPHEKDQEHDSAAIGQPPTGAVLDIGHGHERTHLASSQPDDNDNDDTNLSPDATSAIGGSGSPQSGGGVGIAIGGDDGRRGGNPRDSSRSGFSGFARWKRDISTLSGLTALGLNFRHSDEKSPVSDYGGDNGMHGFIYGTYDPEMDNGGRGGGNEGGRGMRAEHMRTISTQSSSRSFGRFGSGKKRSSGAHPPTPGNGNGMGSGTGKGKGRLSSRIGSSAFPFRLSSSSRRGESSSAAHQHDRPHDDESLSGFTSLSYASNPNIATAAAAGYLDIQPPSYAASVSQNTGSGSNASSPPSVPRSVTRSPQSQTKDLGIPSPPQDVHGPSPLSEEIPPLFVPEQPPSQATPHTRDNEAPTTGPHILGIGGGLSGVGGPISMRAALRGLSPRISKSRSMEQRQSKSKGKGKEMEMEQREEVGTRERKQRGLPQPPRPQPASQLDIASGQQESGSTAQVTSVPVALPTAVAIASNLPSGTRTDSPIRALPPIPILQPSSGTSPPRPQPHSQPQPTPQPAPSQATFSEPIVSQETHEPPSPMTSSPESYLTVPESSPFKLSFDQDPRVAGTPTPTAPSSSSSSSNNNHNERRFKPRSSLGSAVGLGSPIGTIQSFAEAAALAAAPPIGGILVEGGGAGASSSGSGSGGNDGEPSEGTARRLSTASRVHFEDDPTSSSPSPTSLGEDSKARFRLTPPSGQSPPPGTSEASPSSAEFNRGPSQPSEYVGTASFLDFSSQPSSLHSRRQSEVTGLERGTSIGTTTDTSYEPEHSRIWSMQLPGRRNIAAPPEGLKSKWSNTTAHTSRTRSESSSSNSGYGSPRAQLSPLAPVPTATTADVGTSDPSSIRNIFPFPLAIPPSPHMPEGFAGVEPSPSLMSPTASIPVFTPPSARRSDYGRRLHVPTGTSGGAGTSRHIAHGRRGPDDSTDNGERHETSPHPGNTSEMATDSPTDSFPYSISEVHFRTSVGTESDLDIETGRIQHARHHSVAHHPPLPSTPLTPQRFTPQQEQSQSQSQSQQGSSGSIVQRVFGGGGGTGGSTGGGGAGAGVGSGTASPRTPRSGFLKPSNL